MLRLTAYLNIREVGERVFSDLAETWWMIGISMIGACILSFIWIVLMRFLAGKTTDRIVIMRFLAGKH